MNLDVAVGDFDVAAAGSQRDVFVGRHQHMIGTRGNPHAFVGGDLNVVALRLCDVLAVLGDTFDAAGLRELADALAGVQVHFLSCGEMLVLPGHQVDVLAARNRRALRRAKRNPGRRADRQDRCAAIVAFFGVGAVA